MLRLHLDESSLNLRGELLSMHGYSLPQVILVCGHDENHWCASILFSLHCFSYNGSASHAWMQPSQPPQERNTVLSTSFYSRGNRLCAGAACPRSWSESLAWGTGSNWPIDCILTAQQRLWVSIWKAQNHKTQGKGTAQRNNIKISGRKQKIQDATLPKVLWIFRFLKWLLAVRLNSAVEVGEVELGTTGLWRTWDLGSLLSHHSVHSPNAQSPILHLKFLVFTQVMCQQMLESPSPGRMKKVQTWYCNSLYYSSGWARSKERKFS